MKKGDVIEGEESHILDDAQGQENRRGKQMSKKEPVLLCQVHAAKEM